MLSILDTSTMFKTLYLNKYSLQQLVYGDVISRKRKQGKHKRALLISNFHNVLIGQFHHNIFLKQAS